MLYHLAIKLRATEEGTTGFLKVAFLDSHVRLALNYSSWDAETESVSLDVSPVDSNIMEEDVELAELCRAEAEWIDLSPLDLGDRNVQQAEDQAQQLFAQDEAIDVQSSSSPAPRGVHSPPRRAQDECEASVASDSPAVLRSLEIASLAPGPDSDRQLPMARVPLRATLPRECRQASQQALSLRGAGTWSRQLRSLGQELSDGPSAAPTPSHADRGEP